jgi:hypothetical protein
MAALKKQYGDKKGEEVYYAMENQERAPKLAGKKKK